MLEIHLGLDQTSPSGLVWVLPTHGRFKVGQSAFTSRNKNGYYKGRLLGQDLYAHRVVFFLYHGYWAEQVDHWDGCKQNNAPSNLRPITTAGNQHNVFHARGYYRSRNKWRVSISVNGTPINLGSVNTEEEARALYLRAKSVYHPDAARHCYAAS